MKGEGFGGLIVFVIIGYYFLKNQWHARKMRKLKEWYKEYIKETK